MPVIELGNPQLLLLAPLFIALTIMFHYFSQKIKRSLEIFHYPPVPRLSRIAAKRGFRRSKWRGVSLALKLAIVILIVFSLTSPVLLTFSEVSEKVEVPIVMEKDLEGQIILAIDVSASMGIKDVPPMRLEVAKQILTEFVQNSSSKVGFGVVAFESEIRKALPVTGNRSEVLSTIENLTQTEGLPCLEELTDIGHGLQTSIDLLTPFVSSNRTSAIILVSDGFANYGYPDPFQSVFQATARAKSSAIPIYALRIAKLGQDTNDELMKQIATDTGGKYIDSMTSADLRQALDTIGKYYVPTHEWSSEVQIKTTIPTKSDLGAVLMLVASAFIIGLWVGNYKHYRTSF